MRPWLEQRYSKAKRSVYPCQSCGIFFVRSAVATRAFAEGLYSYVVYAADKWDQYIYQVMHRVNTADAPHHSALHTARTLHAHCVHTAGTLLAHTTCTLHAEHAHSWYDACTPRAHR